MTESEGPVDPQSQGERDDKPELDVDSAFAAIIADFSLPVPHGVGPWPASEDLDDEDDPDAPGPGTPDAGAPGGIGPAGDGPGGDEVVDRRITGADGPPSLRRARPDPAPGTPGPSADGLAGTAAAVPAVPGPEERWTPPARRISLPGEEDLAAAGPTSRRPGDDEDEEGYQPPEPPPLPRGDLISRVAWAAVLGGPVFLLVAAMVKPPDGWLLLLALVAFVGGFVTLVARMPQDRPDDPDDGAVV